MKIFGDRLLGQSKNGDAGRFCWGKEQGVGKVEIEGHQAPFLGSSNLDDVLVACSPQLLFPDGRYVVTGFAKQLHCGTTKILVQLEPQTVRSRGMST